MPHAVSPASFQALASFKVEGLARLSQRQADAIYQQRIGMRLQECQLIGLVGSAKTLSFKSLCRAASIDKSYASRLVARLIAAGFIRKEDDPADLRSFFIRLTRSGERMHRVIYEVAAERNRRWLAVLAPADREHFMRSLEKLTEAAQGLAGEDRASPPVPAMAREEEQDSGAQVALSQAPMLALDPGIVRQLHDLLGSILTNLDEPQTARPKLKVARHAVSNLA